MRGERERHKVQGVSSRAAALSESEDANLVRDGEERTHPRPPPLPGRLRRLPEAVQVPRNGRGSTMVDKVRG